MRKRYDEGFTREKARVEEVLKTYAKWQHTNDDDPEKAELERKVRGSVVPGVYEHWKSMDRDPKFYLVLGVEFDANGKRPPVVSYIPLYLPHAGKRVFRELLDQDDGFLAPIDRPHGPPRPYIGQRFKVVRVLTEPQLSVMQRLIPQLRRAHKRRDVLDLIGLS